MTVEEAKGMCKDRSNVRKRSLPTSKGNGRDVMYVCKYFQSYNSWQRMQCIVVGLRSVTRVFLALVNCWYLGISS
jgi:hypothetical protein